MAADNATLKFTGEFDGSQMTAALIALDDQFIAVEKTAEKSFEGISNAEGQAAGIAKTNAYMRASLDAERADAAIKNAQREADEKHKVQAKAEQEYLAAEKQAMAAEAVASSDRFNRAIEKEHAHHQERLKSLAGNDEAMEAETRRHVAAMSTLEADLATKSEQAIRTSFQRFGAIGNQLQGLQIAFFGIGQAVDGTDSKFGKMIGTAGLLASGALGMAQAWEVASASMAGMGATMAVALPVLAAVGLALGVFLEHRKHLEELAKKQDWLGDPTKYAEVQAAVKAFDDANAKMAQTMRDPVVAAMNAASAAYGGLSLEMGNAESANRRLQAVTGLTRDELIKLYGSLDKVKEAFDSINNSRMIALQETLEKALLSGKKDSLEKELALQAIANRQAEESIKEHYAAVAIDQKKTTDEKKRAVEKEGLELALQEKINLAMLQEVREKWANKQDKKTDSAEAAAAKEIHRMELESAKQLDTAMAALEENKFARTIGTLNGESDAIDRTYAERQAAAGNNVAALFELDEWYYNQKAILMAKATAAGVEYNKTALKDYQEYTIAMARMDSTLKEQKLQAAGDFQAFQKQQVLDQEAAAAEAIERQRAKWVENGTSEVTARKRADELIDHNHQIVNGKIQAMNKATVDADTQMRLAAYGNILAASAGFVQAIGNQNKALFAITKALEAANVIVHGMAAEALLTAQLGIAAPPAIALQKVEMGIQMATIGATTIKGFKGGGYTGDGDPNQIAGYAHKREVVWTAGDVDRHGGPAAVEAMRNGAGGGGDTYNFGGTVNHMAPGTTEAQAQALGGAIARGQLEEARRWKQAKRYAETHDVPE